MIEQIKLVVSFQKRNASNQLVDVSWSNGSSSTSVFTGTGTNEAAAKAAAAAQFAPFAAAAQQQGEDATSALAALNNS